MKKTIDNFKKIDESVLKSTNGGSLKDFIAGYIYEMKPRKRY